jgi:hypothetical protein
MVSTNFDGNLLIDGYEASLTHLDASQNSIDANLFTTVLGTSTVVVYYKMRGSDSGRIAPGYVTWVVTNTPDFTGAQAAGSSTPSLLGSIIANSTVLVDTWRI